MASLSGWPCWPWSWEKSNSLRRKASIEQCDVKRAGVVRLRLINISPEAVIPAKAGIQPRNTGFRVKPGMTIKGNGLLTRHTGG